MLPCTLLRSIGRLVTGRSTRMDARVGVVYKDSVAIGNADDVAVLRDETDALPYRLPDSGVKTIVDHRHVRDPIGALFLCFNRSVWRLRSSCAWSEVGTQQLECERTFPAAELQLILMRVRPVRRARLGCRIVNRG